MTELTNTFELCDIWRLRNPKQKDSLFSKIIGLGLFNVDWTFFVLNVFARVYLQNRCLNFVLQWPLIYFICLISPLWISQKDHWQKIAVVNFFYDGKIEVTTTKIKRHFGVCFSINMNKVLCVNSTYNFKRIMIYKHTKIKSFNEYNRFN